MPKKKETIEEVLQKIVEVDFDEEMKSSYLDYSLEVIGQRAVPDIRDGLKPVQRRVIYSMFDMGITSEKGYKKSARVVGECFVKGTLVYREDKDGFKNVPIENVKIGDKVLTSDGIKQVTKTFIMPKKETVKIVTNSPLSNICTTNQKFKVLNKDYTFDWTEANALKENDYILANEKVLLEFIKSQKNFDFEKKSFEKFRECFCIPYVKDFFIEKGLEFGGNARFLLEDGSIVRKDLFDSGIFDTIKNFEDKTLFNFVKECIEKEFVFVKVKEVKKYREMVTYDIQVEEQHEFLANGMMVHNCLGKYHAHGDASVYDALVRMAQDFMLNIPLVDGHGNFGNIDGDSAAAMRYTECRLPKIANEVTAGLKDKIVPFIPNFDGEEMEPTVMPVRYPNLLVNGTNGIAVGLMSSVPPHNMNEVIDMFVFYLKKEASSRKKLPTNEELLEYLKGPDFPTGGIITNKKDLLEAYKTGDGKITVRGKIEEEKAVNGRINLIITEIPYSSTNRKSVLVDKIAKLVLDKKIEEIMEVRDESSKGDVRVVLEVRKGADLEKVKNKLYKFSPLQDTIPMKMIALLDGKIVTFSLVDYCKIVTDFQKEIIRKEFNIRKGKLEKKIEIFQGLVKAFDYIDIIIDAIRHAEKVENAKQCLMNGSVTGIKFASKKNETQAKKFRFTEVQAENILETTLRKLNTLEFNELSNELLKMQKDLDYCNKVLSDKKEIDKVIIANFQRIAKTFGSKRKTKIVDSEVITYAEEIKELPANVICDRYGYLKCFDENNYSKLDEASFDGIKADLKTTNLDNIWCFSEDGFMYQVKVSSLGYNRPKDRGSLLETKVTKKSDKDILTIINQNSDDFLKLLFVTKKGLVKIVNKDEFKTIRAVTSATKLSDGDELLSVIPLKDLGKQILLKTTSNFLKFKVSDIVEAGKTGKGVIGVKLTGEESVINCEVFEKTEKEVKVGKDTIDLSKIPLQKRAGKGVKIEKVI